jgi:hypothetical protein
MESKQKRKIKRRKIAMIEPRKSILKNEILKTASFSIVASISVISMSF